MGKECYVRNVYTKTAETIHKGYSARMDPVYLLERKPLKVHKILQYPLSYTQRYNVNVMNLLISIVMLIVELDPKVVVETSSDTKLKLTKN